MKKIKRILMFGFSVSAFLTAFIPAHSVQNPVSAKNMLQVSNVSEEGILEYSKHQTPTGVGFEQEAADEVVSSGVQKRVSREGNSCGDHATWMLDKGVLIISGTGPMKDYSSSELPEWSSLRSQITSVIIENGITSVGAYSFYDCMNLTEVSIPESVTSLGRIAFAECVSLEHVQLPSGITILHCGVFANCKSLKSINLDHIAWMYDYALQGVGIHEISIGASMTAMSPLAFWNSSVQSFLVSPRNTEYMAKDGVLYKDQGKTLFLYPANSDNTFFAIPENVTKIGYMAMAFAKNLKNVTIPDSVTELEESAFANSSALTFVKIPDSVRSVGDFTFYGCSSLITVSFGEGLTGTSYQMFFECRRLKEIYFGNTLKTLDAYTFCRCSSLTDVTLPTSVTQIGVGCFGDCYALKSFSSKSLKHVPYSAFWGCSALENVELNEGVTDIYRCAFYGCDGLQNITLPVSTKYVHSIAFPNDTNITCLNPDMQPFGVNGYRYLQKVSISGTREYTMAYQVLKIVNKKRSAAGLGALRMDSGLLETAMNRAAEISLCFSHTRPDSSICFDADENMCAENIAAGSRTADTVMLSWMNSKGHKENILSETFTTIGIGCFIQNGTYYWTQCFGTKSDTSNCSRPANRTVTQKISLATEAFNEEVAGIDAIYSFGNQKSYAYHFKINISTSKLKGGASTKAQMMVVNPGFEGAVALLNNEGITWTSNHVKIASINSAGRITGSKKGTAQITGTMKYYRAKGKVRVTSNAALDTVKSSVEKGKILNVRRQKGNKLKVTAKKVSGVSGYQFGLARNKKMTKDRKNVAVKKPKVTFKKVRTKQTYYVCVRAYKKVSGKKKYGKWSAVRKIKEKA